MTVTIVPVVRHPLRLHARVSRYRCTTIGCDRDALAHNTDRVARAGHTTTRRCARYILCRLMIDRMTISAGARERRLSWDTVEILSRFVDNVGV